MKHIKHWLRWFTICYVLTIIGSFPLGAVLFMQMPGAPNFQQLIGFLIVYQLTVGAVSSGPNAAIAAAFTFLERKDDTV